MTVEQGREWGFAALFKRNVVTEGGFHGCRRSAFEGDLVA